jgi:hypothetical protein
VAVREKGTGIQGEWQGGRGDGVSGGSGEGGGEAIVGVSGKSIGGFGGSGVVVEDKIVRSVGLDKGMAASGTGALGGGRLGMGGCKAGMIGAVRWES